MGEFFRFVLRFFNDWRRRMGIAALVIAFFVTFCWLLLDGDLRVAAFTLPDLRTHYFASDRDRFVWVAIQENGQRPLPATLLKWATDDFHSDCSACYPFLLFDRRRFNWPGLWGGPKPTTPMIVSMTAIPYWSIVLPLTLITFWLLLSRPGKSTQKKIIEPIHAGQE